MRANRTESGQIAVLLVAVFFGSIAMAAVAIDGGNAFVQRRIAQNAADNAALAAASYFARNSSPSEIGLLTELIQIAQANGIDDWDGVLTNEVNDNVEAYYTDIKGNRIPGCNIVGSCAVIPTETYGFEIIAHKQVDTFLARLIGWNTIAVQARGVAVMYPTFAGLVNMANLAIGSCPEIKAYDGSGNKSEVIGGIHSNDDLYLSGSDYHFHGRATHVEGYTPAGTNNTFDASSPANGSIITNPLVGLQTNMFAPGGAQVQGMTVHNLSSGGTVNTGRLILEGYYNPSTGQMAEGVYYAGNNAIEISDSNMTGTVTFVSNNQIKISGSDNSFTAYIDSLLIFSNKQPAEPCKDWVVDVGGSGNPEPVVSHVPDFNNPVVVQESSNIYRGLIYAPRGQVVTSGSKSTIRGAILAQAIKLNGSQELIIYDSGPGTPRIELIK